jgi:hypothetical protein
MRLTRKDMIAGYPSKTIRRFLRYLRQAEGAGVQFAAYYLKMDEPGWMNTIKGNALTQAKFLKPITRDKATFILNNFLIRISTLNADPYFFMGVKKVEVFGSYLSEAAFVNDIDLFVHYDSSPVSNPVTKCGFAKIASDWYKRMDGNFGTSPTKYTDRHER